MLNLQPPHFLKDLEAFKEIAEKYHKNNKQCYPGVGGIHHRNKQ